MHKSKFVGVLAAQGGWAAQIARKGKVYYLGFHDLEKDAATAVDRGVLMTRAYVKNPLRLHLNHVESSSIPIDDTQKTVWEERMLEDLKTRYPYAQKEYKFLAEANLTAQQHTDRIRRFFLLRKDYKEQEEEAIKEFESTLMFFVEENIKLRQQLDALNELRIDDMKVLAKLKGREGMPAFKMTPIVHKPKAPEVTSENPPEAPKDSPAGEEVSQTPSEPVSQPLTEVSETETPADFKKESDSPTEA